MKKYTYIISMSNGAYNIGPPLKFYADSPIRALFEYFKTLNILNEVQFVEKAEKKEPITEFGIEYPEKIIACYDVEVRKVQIKKRSSFMTIEIRTKLT